MEMVDLGKEFLGKSMDHAMGELGTPVAEDRFELGLSVLEFRIELTNLFDETRRTENPPEIREATWSVSAEQNLTLWFTRSETGQDWQAIHFLAWHPNSQF